MTSPRKGVTKIYLHLSSGNYLGVVYTLETFASMYPIPILGYIRYFLFAMYYSSQDVMCKQVLKLKKPNVFYMLFFEKKAIHIM